MTADADRARVCALARAWLGTPWHHNAAVRGAGVDCAQLVKAVYVEAGLIADFAVPDYPMDYMLHRDDDRLCQAIEAAGGRRTDTPGPADVAVWQFGRSFSHAGLVVEWPGRVIHAYRPWGEVVETPFDADQLHGREMRFYTFWT